MEWRDLQEGEEIIAGDESTDNSNSDDDWQPVHDSRGHIVGDEWTIYNKLRYRRLVTDHSELRNILSPIVIDLVNGAEVKSGDLSWRPSDPTWRKVKQSVGHIIGDAYTMTHQVKYRRKLPHPLDIKTLIPELLRTE